MKKSWKTLLLVTVVLAAIAGLLFAVYYWNLDQKLLAWAHTQIERIKDRKEPDKQA